MKSKNSMFTIACTLMLFFGTAVSFGQTWGVFQGFENGGTGSDACWTGYNNTASPTTNDFFTVTSPVQSGTYAGGMYSCCGGPSTNDPTFYISPVLPAGAHSVRVYLRQSSSFNEDFEIGTVSSLTGANFTVGYTKSTWPSPVAWQQTVTAITTDAVNNRIAFRVPPASLKTYYLDSIFIDNSGNATSGCNYVTTTSVDQVQDESSPVSIYPNPFDEELIVTINEGQPLTICLFDMASRELIRQSFSKSLILKTDQLGSGMYFYTVSDRHGIVAKGKVVK